MISVGDRFICIEDVYLSDGEKAYTKGKVYVSEIPGSLTNDSGYKYHQWPIERDKYRELFWKHFIRRNNKRKQLSLLI